MIERIFKPKKLNAQKGASLVEALIAIGLMSFVIVGILSGFSQRQMVTRNQASKNIAVRLAEIRMEELLKFPADQLTQETYIEFVVHKNDNFEIFQEANDPGEIGQYKRTTTINLDLLGQLATIEVRVEYPLSNNTYPHRVLMQTRRAIRRAGGGS